MTLIPRFLLLLRALGAKYLTEDLRRDLNIPNKMVLSSWRTGKRQPTEEQMQQVARWAEKRLAMPGLWVWVKYGDTGARYDERLGSILTMKPYQAQLEQLLEKSPLAKLRESHGLSQYDAAQLIGVSRATLIHWEKTFTLAEGDAWDRASKAYGRKK